MTPVLSCSDLAVRHGSVEALRAIGLELHAGEMLGLLGPNGAGKSTLARALAGLQELAQGEVRLGDAPLATLSRREAAKRIAYLPQEVPADLPFTAAEVALMGRTPHLGALGLDGPADRERVASALAEVDASALADRRLGALSGGERRRILMARVLVQEAPIWILDEPTAHLDLAHQHLVLRLARAHADRGGAVICVLHDLAQASSVCDRVAVIHGGRLDAIGPPAECLRPALLAQVFAVPFLQAVHPVSGEPLLVPELRFRRN